MWCSLFTSLFNEEALRSFLILLFNVHDVHMYSEKWKSYDIQPPNQGVLEKTWEIKLSMKWLIQDDYEFVMNTFHVHSIFNLRDFVTWRRYRYLCMYCRVPFNVLSCSVCMKAWLMKLQITLCDVEANNKSSCCLPSLGETITRL